jgi:hypothetical protein
VLIAILLVGFGATFVSIGIRQRALGQPVAGGVRTTGVITGFETHGGQDQSYTPHVRFVTTTGAEIDVSAATQQNKPTVGAPVTVSYRPADPREAHVLHSGHHWVLYLVVGAGLLALMPIAALHARLRRLA